MAERRRYVGIVGHEAAKFTKGTEAQARRIIRRLLSGEDAVLVSGGCHLGGIDIWAEEEYALLKDRPAPVIYKPKTLQWQTGFKPRNVKIARKSHECYCLVVAEYPESYTGMRFDRCYHCNSRDHIKSGGCWTTKLAEQLGKQVGWYIIN